MDVREKRNEMLSIFDRLNEIQKEKQIVVEKQQYEACAKLRDEEKSLIKSMDEVGGIKDCYNKIVSTEKTLHHLETITNSIEELEKLQPDMKKLFEDLKFEKHLLKLYRERDKAYVSVLQLRDFLDINEKKIEK